MFKPGSHYPDGVFRSAFYDEVIDYKTMTLRNFMAEFLRLAACMYVLKEDNFHNVNEHKILDNPRLKSILETWLAAKQYNEIEEEYIRYEFLLKYHAWKGWKQSDHKHYYENVRRRYVNFYTNNLKNKVNMNWD